MTFTPRTGPSMVTKIHYKKYRLPRKQKKLLKKKGLYDKTSLHYKELMYRIMEVARGISKLGRKGTADQIPQGFVYAPYIPMMMDPTPVVMDEETLARYTTKSIDARFYQEIKVPAPQEIITGLNLY